TQRSCRDGELHRARDRVVIGQRQRVVTQSQRGGHELVGQRSPIQERERRMAVQLRVHRTYVRTPRDRIQALQDTISPPAPAPETPCPPRPARQPGAPKISLDKLLVAAKLFVVSAH